jgi:hypothetical protein
MLYSDVIVGYFDPSTAASGAAGFEKLMYRGSKSGTSNTSMWYFTIRHQPVLLGSRMYLTIGASGRTATGVAASFVGTWYTLDLTDLGNNVFTRPTLVARGPTDEAMLVTKFTTLTPSYQPCSAVVDESEESWTFGTYDWTRWILHTSGLTQGEDPVARVVRVSLSGPRAVSAGPATLFSGSVPRLLSGEMCYEAGFLGRPSVLVTAAATGSLAAGDYSVSVVWKYVDNAGQIHRSAPAIPYTVTSPASGALTILAANPLLTERARGQVVIEVYVTPVNPSSDDSHYLQSTTVPSSTGQDGLTVITISSGLVTTSEELYTDASEFINSPVPADGGIAVVGRRVWVASGNTAYASKLLVPGKGIAWNDEGSLQVNLPAGAGRILALEGMGDKLVIFCERGIYATQDGGPDNTGLGPDIAHPLRVSDIGCAGPRSTCWTERGLVFCAPLDSTGHRGGPWLLDQGFTPTYLGGAASEYFQGSWEPEVAYSAQRQQVYILTRATHSPIDTGSGVVVLDLRSGKHAMWDMNETANGALLHVACVAGLLWVLSSGGSPTRVGGTPGSDGATAYAMLIKTKDLPADGRDPFGWARVRSVNVLGTRQSGAHTLSYSADLDGDRTITSSDALTASSASTTWPTNRQAPEWRLPSPKCSTIAVQLSASPATAQWSAIRLDVAPLPGRAPAKDRV